MCEDGVLQIHGFFVDVEKKRISFDLVIDFDVDDRQGLAETIKQKVKIKYPEYTVLVTFDTNFSD